MDENGRENRRHRVDYYKVPPWNMMSHYQVRDQNAFQMNVKIGILCEEKDSAIRERDRALAEKKAALDERAAAIKERDEAIIERDNVLKERDNAIAALQFHESSINAMLSRGTRVSKRMNRPIDHHPNNVDPALSLREDRVSNKFPESSVPCEAPISKKGKRTETNKNVVLKSSKSPKMKKMSDDLNRQVSMDGSKSEWDAQDLGDLNRQVSMDGSKSEWDAQDLGSMNQIWFDESSMPVPVCSCTGIPRQCYKWGNGGWQSSCCTTSLSVYPLPQMPNKRHARMGGRKMSGSVFSRLLTRLAAGGHDLSAPLDLKSYWAKHGSNRYITIK